MLRRAHHLRRSELEFASPEVPKVVRDQVFHTTGDRKLQDMIIPRIRQIGSPPEINGHPPDPPQSHQAPGGETRVMEQIPHLIRRQFEGRKDRTLSTFQGE